MTDFPLAPPHTVRTEPSTFALAVAPTPGIRRSLQHIFGRRPALWAMLLSGGFLYFLLFVPPYTPIFVADGNDAEFLNDGTRLLQGQVMYRDFFAVVFPGTPTVYALLIKLFGPRAWIPNAALMALGMGFAWLSIAIARRLVSGAAVLLPGLLFLCLALRYNLDPSEHWYSALLVIAATAVVIDQRNTPRLAVAGALCGLAAWFSQNNGFVATAGLAGFVLWEKVKDGKCLYSVVRSEVSLLASAAAVLAICIFDFVLRAGIGKFIYCTVEFPLKYWSHFPPNRFSDNFFIGGVKDALNHAAVSRPALALLLPAVYLLALARHSRQAGAPLTPRRKSLVLVNTMGLSLLASVANSPSFNRVPPVSLPAFLVLVWLVSQSGRPNPYVVGLLLAGTLGFMLRCAIWAQANVLGYCETFSGRIALTRSNDNRTVYQWLLENTAWGIRFRARRHGRVLYARFAKPDQTAVPHILRLHAAGGSGGCSYSAREASG